ncbi:stalk domain-containing protein [Paenibacillus pini]|uniref:Copper amine oxidase domain protein n=1 Tax=Paenibacillus pini JCM 16418 TaxID=1236976 RepID=W7YIR1_9BACL|nr:stalk domain-containing protein [Paenibacillus pini]GAF08352.1 copper amine oxidase domain protein [Paenibacillus pini JCM 16418]
MTKSKSALLFLLGTSLLFSASAHAETTPQKQMSSNPITIYLDGRQLQPEANPLNVKGTVLVPMRGLFEAQGAKLTWNNTNKTVTATKDRTTLTYRLGDHTANLNGQTINLSVPGQISNGYSLIPLRFVSEALGSTVTWDASNHSVQISSSINYETSILWGVNLRSSPDSTSVSTNIEMLSAGAKVHVIREVDALWLEVRTEDHQTGYISAKPKYTDYSSPALIEQQGDALLAYGKKYLGTPYVFGASPDQTATFDCSSFVKRVFQDTLSIDLPRVSYDQAKVGKEVGIGELRKGDLLFFSARKLDIGHVAIYAGNNQILHTYSKELGVHVETFDSQWKKRFVTARRVF